MVWLASKETETDELQKQARVQCNGPCSLLLEGQQEVRARLRELNWYGAVLDRIDVEPNRYLLEKHPSLRFDFTIPREYGQVEVTTDEYVVNSYFDVIENRELLSIQLKVPEGEGLELIRPYLQYRNRSFIRSTRRRNRKAKSVAMVLILWVPILVLLALLGLGWAYRVFLFGEP